MKNRSKIWKALRGGLFAVLFLIVSAILSLPAGSFQPLPGVFDWFPPDGLSFALLLGLGAGFAPLVALSAALSGLFVLHSVLPVWMVLLAAGVVALVYGLAAGLFRRVVRLSPNRWGLREIQLFILFSTCTSCILAFLFMLTRPEPGVLLSAKRLDAGFDWWVDETLVFLLFTPALLLFVMPPARRLLAGQLRLPKLRMPRLTVGYMPLVQALSLLLVLYLVFGVPALRQYEPLYLLGLPLIWIGMEHGLKGNTLGLLAVGVGTALAANLSGFTPVQLDRVQLFLLIIAVISLLFSAVRGEQIRSVRRIQHDEHRLRALLENSSDAITLLDAGGVVLYDSPSAPGMLGYRAEELLGKNGFELIHPDDLPHVREVFQAVLQSPRARVLATARMRCKDGSWRWTEGVAVNLLDEPSVGAVVLNYRDITERKRVEEFLRSSEDRYRDLVDNSQDLICTHDLEGRIISVNPHVAQVLGYTPDQIMQMNLRDFLTLQTRKYFERYLARICRYGIAIGVMQVQTSRGETRIWEFRNTLRTEGVAAPIVRGMARDVTAQRQAEAATRAAELKYRSIFENSVEGIYQSSPDGQLLTANPALARMFGYARPAELITAFEDPGRPFYVIPGRRSQYMQALEKQDFIAGFESQAYRKDGSVIWISESARAVRSAGGALLYYEGTIENITSRKQAELEIGQRNEEIRLLYEASRELSRSLDLEDHYQVLQRFVTGLMPCDSIIITTYDAAQQLIRCVYAMDDGQRMDVSGIPPIPLGDEGKGTQSLVIRSGQPLILNDYQTRMRTSATKLYVQPDGTVVPLDEIPDDEDVARSALIVPILLEQEVAGVIQVLSYKRDSYSPENLRFVQAIASQFAMASNNTLLYHQAQKEIIERKQAEAEIHVRTQELSSLYELSRSLASVNELDEILSLVSRQAVESVHITFARVALLEGDGFVIRSAFPVRPLGRDLRVGSRLPLSSMAYSRSVLEQNVPVVLAADALPNNPLEREALLLDSVESLCLIPLSMESSGPGSERALGLLMLGEARNAAREPFTPEKMRLAQSIADQAAVAIRRVLLHDQTERRLKQILALSDIDRAITSSTGLETSLGTVLRHVREQLSVDAASVLVFRPASNSLTYAAGRGFRTNAFARSHGVNIGEGYAGRAALERRVIHIRNLAEGASNPRLHKAMVAEGFASYYGVPLIAKGEVKGVLEIFRRTSVEPDQEWMDFLQTLAGQAAIAIENSTLFDGLKRSNIDLGQAYDATIEGWSRALDLRDKETEGHTQRVTELTVRLAELFNFQGSELEHVRRGALLHDIGKMGVPDGILLKPGPLTDEEWVIMRKHPQLAYEMLSPIRYLHSALDIPYCHHERWDGAGYPRGLRGEQIPLAARIFAVVDVWDALTSDRAYRPAWSEEKALEHICAGAGTHFDPRVVSICLQSGLLTLKNLETIL